MNESDVSSWTCLELIENVHHELNQKSAIALSFMHALLNEENHGFVNEQQKEMLILLEEEIKTIRLITETMEYWQSTKN